MAKRHYYKHLPHWPRFEWTDAQKENLPQWFRKKQVDVDGDLPAAFIKSWGEFHKFVEDGRFTSDEFIFRGHRDCVWDLVPSIARSNDSVVFSEKEARDTLASFRKASRGRKSFDPSLDDDLEMWALGQHHGLRTPLLDWTESPYVALFFAFEGVAESDSSNSSRCVFAINKTKLEERARQLIEDEAYSEQSVIRIFQPGGDSNRRLLSQAGLFLSVPPNESVTSWLLTHFGEHADDMDSFSNIIMKIHIPNDDRKNCLRMLRRMNIHHASLFPDLIGSSNFSNFEMEIYRKQDQEGHAS